MHASRRGYEFVFDLETSITRDTRIRSYLEGGQYVHNSNISSTSWITDSGTMIFYYFWIERITGVKHLRKKHDNFETKSIMISHREVQIRVGNVLAEITNRSTLHECTNSTTFIFCIISCHQYLVQYWTNWKNLNFHLIFIVNVSQKQRFGLIVFINHEAYTPILYVQNITTCRLFLINFTEVPCS